MKENGNIKENSKLKYILIVLVAIIWGIIILRFLSNLSTDSKHAVNMNMHSTTPILISHDTTYSLLNNYPDPFLTPRQSELKIDSTSHKKKFINKTHYPVFTPPAFIPPPMPEVKYMGYTQPSDERSRMAIISLNGIEKICILNQKISDHFFISFISPEKIICRYYSLFYVIPIGSSSLRSSKGTGMN